MPYYMVGLPLLVWVFLVAVCVVALLAALLVVPAQIRKLVWASSGALMGATVLALFPYYCGYCLGYWWCACW